MAVKLYVIMLIFLNITSTIANPGEILENNAKPNEETDKNLIVQKCKTCRVYANSFKKGLERTAKGKFEGGDADWEERKMGRYATSEVRLAEIQEMLCTDVQKDELSDQCFQFANENEEKVEEYWAHYNQVDIFKYLCVDKLNVCCPDARFGAKCEKCPGFPNNVCSKRGTCDGEGTKTGTGECVCERGYVGKNCEDCHLDYVDVSKGGFVKICSKCHDACDGGCSGKGPNNCFFCHKGWMMVSGECIDIDECLNGVCEPNEYCINKPGGYFCRKCDVPCKRCSGPTIRGCLECSPGYSYKFGHCTEQNNKDPEQVIKRVSMILTVFFIMTLAYYFKDNVLSAVGIFLLILFTYAAEFMTTPVRNALEDYFDWIVNLFRSPLEPYVF